MIPFDSHFSDVLVQPNQIWIIQPGTGLWSVVEALEAAVPAPSLVAAVLARQMSMLRTERLANAKVVKLPSAPQVRHQGSGQTPWPAGSLAWTCPGFMERRVGRRSLLGRGICNYRLLCTDVSMFEVLWRQSFCVFFFDNWRWMTFQQAWKWMEVENESFFGRLYNLDNWHSLYNYSYITLIFYSWNLSAVFEEDIHMPDWIYVIIVLFKVGNRKEEETFHNIATLLFPFSTFFAKENGWEIWVWLEVACYHCDFQSWLHFARLSTGANDQGLWRQTRLGESSLSCLEPQDWYIQTWEAEVSWEKILCKCKVFWGFAYILWTHSIPTSFCFFGDESDLWAVLLVHKI